MSSLNGDKSRFHRERKAKLARREKSQAIRKQMKAAAAPPVVEPRVVTL
jgi:hypothetical protein